MDSSDAGLIGGGGLAAIVATAVLGLGPIGAAAATLGGAYLGHEIASKNYSPNLYK